MSKNNQRNLAEINLGNETYERGEADGFANRPKAIKKSHRHVHRYHIGYKHGVERRLELSRNRVASFRSDAPRQLAVAGTGIKPAKKGGWLSRILWWCKP